MSAPFPSLEGVITLKKGRDNTLRSGHPWIFSGAVKTFSGGLTDGAFVQVVAEDGSPLGSGFYGTGSIAVRLLSVGKQLFNAQHLHYRLADAFALRTQLGLTESTDTTAYRLFNAEGDFLPGLTIDIYDSTAVIQYHSRGITRLKDTIIEVLQSLYQNRIREIIDRSPAAHQTDDAVEETDDIAIKEYGYTFLVNCNRGQKTGFFLDQRENRHLLSTLTRNKRVLNAFCYTGGFSVYAAAGGALHIDSVDVSKPALEYAAQNVTENFPHASHRTIAADCFDFLPSIQDPYDIIVLDPPAFAKQRRATAAALRGYQSINALAMPHIKTGGLLMTYSCSQHVTMEAFSEAVKNAATQAGKKVRILARLGAAPCHPVSIQHPEGNYLKGLLLSVS